MHTTIRLLVIAFALCVNAADPKRPPAKPEREISDLAIICKKMPREGSRIKTLVCRTQRDWEEVRARAQELMGRRINY